MKCIICGRKTQNVTLCGLAECKRHCVECRKDEPCDYFVDKKAKRAERDKQALALRAAGKKYAEIADELGISKQVIDDIMARHGLTQPRAIRLAKIAKRNAEIRKLAGKMKQVEIAEKYHLSTVSVSQILKNSGDHAEP